MVNGAVPAPVAALVALNPKKRIAFKLAERHVLSHNVRRFRFALQSPQHKFGLPVGKHVFAYAKCVRCPCKEGSTTPSHLHAAVTRPVLQLLPASDLLHASRLSA